MAIFQKSQLLPVQAEKTIFRILFPLSYAGSRDQDMDRYLNPGPFETKILKGSEVEFQGEALCKKYRAKILHTFLSSYRSV